MRIANLYVNVIALQVDGKYELKRDKSTHKDGCKYDKNKIIKINRLTFTFWRILSKIREEF